MTEWLLLGAAGFGIAAIGMLYRAVVGPTVQDRVVAINAVGTVTIVVLALVAAARGDPGILDVALVYALLNFVLSIGLAKFLVDRGGVLR